MEIKHPAKQVRPKLSPKTSNNRSEIALRLTLVALLIQTLPVILSALTGLIKVILGK